MGFVDLCLENGLEGIGLKANGDDAKNGAKAAVIFEEIQTICGNDRGTDVESTVQVSPDVANHQPMFFKVQDVSNVLCLDLVGAFRWQVFRECVVIVGKVLRQHTKKFELIFTVKPHGQSFGGLLGESFDHKSLGLAARSICDFVFSFHTRTILFFAKNPKGKYWKQTNCLNPVVSSRGCFA